MHRDPLAVTSNHIDHIGANGVESGTTINGVAQPVAKRGYCVIAGTTRYAIRAPARLYPVAPPPPEDDVVGTTSVQTIVAGGASKHVIPVPRLDAIDSRPATQLVVAGAPDQEVIAAPTEQPVPPGIALQNVRRIEPGKSVV